MVNRKARPTEWRGTRYRSKSEAMMARHLSSGRWDVIYEPEWLRVDGYVPDFVCRQVIDIPGCQQLRPRLYHQLTVIEYKPAAVTATYMEELADRFSAIRARDARSVYWWDFTLWVGSFWESSSQQQLELMSSEFSPLCGGWKWSGFGGGIRLTDPSDQLEFRFDLEESGGSR